MSMAHLPDTPQARRVPAVASRPLWLKGLGGELSLDWCFPQAQRWTLVDNTAAIGMDAGHEGRSTAAVGEGDHQMQQTGEDQGVRPPVPPFDVETARQKVKAAQDAWNTRDPEKVSMAYTEDSKWRNRDEFFEGREAIRAFLQRKWARELDYRLQKNLWCFTENRIAVRFEYESRDKGGQWWRSHGNELWEFDENGLMRRRDASINDYRIEESERRVF